MSIKLYVNTEAASITKAIVLGLGSPQQPTTLREFVQGAEQGIELYLIDPNGSYDSRSGQAGVNVKVSVSVRNGIPDQGEFTISDDSGATTSIGYDDSGAAVEAALNALNSGTGPNGGLVDVTKKATGCYLIVWRKVGARNALTGTSETLSPESSVVGSLSVTGTASIRCQQIVELMAQPIIYSATWAQITNGWSGTLNANNARVVQSLGSSSSIPVYIEVKIDDTVLAQGDTQLFSSVGNLLAQSAGNLPSGLLDTDVTIPRYRPDITSLTGGTATDLDGVATVDLSTGWLYMTGVAIGASAPARAWYLTSGTLAEDVANGVIRPDDYAASTNEKIWKAYF